MVRRLRTGLRRWAAVLRSIVGVPDYERYVVHMSSAHPGVELLTRGEFFAVRQRERFEEPGSRCC